MVRKLLLLACCSALSACDDSDSAAVLLGGGSGGGPATQSAYAETLQTLIGGGPGLTTMSSEFGYVDNPAIGGSGDPGTSGNWYTGANGQYIGGQNSTGISLPLSTEVAMFGSEKDALGQTVQVQDLNTGQTVTTTIVDVGPGQTAQARGVGVDLTYGTARQLGVPVNGSDPMMIKPVTSKDFTQSK